MRDFNRQNLKEIFNVAIRQKPEERQLFIEQACGADENLRLEVESLISSFGKAESFMETPAIGAIAENHLLKPGFCFGHYEIIELLGFGGMGEVYLAQDKKLDRKVAVKILNEKFAAHESNLERFTREAKAASSLNHPNILVIHEIGETDDRHYIISEFVEGKTLREIFKEKNLELKEVLDISVQVANALSAAHQARLIHRDIKPENIMIRPDGYIKILDFGLAKLIEKKKSFIDLEDETAKQNQTAKGVIMGTVNYMSPEQAKGEKIDEQTDIFSLGIVIYEMIAGRTPFAGNSMSETFANLINREPEPISHLVANIPNNLQRIIAKMLCKNKENRYQTMIDVIADLKSLNENLNLGRPHNFNTLNRTEEIKFSTDEARTPTVLTDGNLTFASKHRRKFFTVGFAALFIISILSFGFYNFSPVRNNNEPFRQTKLTRLTNSGNVNHVALSPDGNLIAFETDEAGGVSIWVRQIEMSNLINIVPPKKGNLTFLTFSPDGKLIYYGFFSGDKLVPELFSIPALGGVIRKIPNKNSNFMSFAPDGKRFAQVISNGDSGEKVLVINSVENLEETVLTTRKSPRSFNVVGKACAWSPDGKTIAVISNDRDVKGQFSTIISVNSIDGAEKVLSAKRWSYLDSLKWLNDGSGLFVVGSDAPESPLQIWFVSTANGEARMLSKDFNNYSQIDVTANGNQIVAVQESQKSGIWFGKNVRNSNDFKEIISETGALDSLVTTADGNIIFRSDSGGKPNLWAIKPDGSGKKQITVDAQVDERGLCATPDGKQIFFPARRDGKVNLWRVSAEGGELTQITDGDGEFYPLCAPDNRSLIYQKGFGYGVKSTLWKTSLDGDEAVQLTDYLSMRPALSPDGQRIAFFYITEDKWRIGIVSADGDGIEKSVAVPDGVIDRLVRWSPDGKSLIYLANEGKIGNVWSLSFNSQKPQQITDFNNQLITDFVPLPDGKGIIATRANRFNDVVSISEQ